MANDRPIKTPESESSHPFLIGHDTSASGVNPELQSLAMREMLI
jgi:hypothetical protein